MKTDRWLLAALLVASTAPARADTGEPIVVGETHTLRSEVLGEERRLLIHLPTGYAQATGGYPVLYLLDGETRFLHTVGTLDSLARDGHVPPMIVVGVTNTDRTRDLTPVHPEPAEGEPDRVPTAGGADRFLAFLTDELVPWVEGEYRTVPQRMLFGHSLGGLFALHALVSRPEAFDGYVAVSPSVQWAEGEIMPRLAAFLERPLAERKHLYLTLADEGGPMQENYLRLVELLRYRAPEKLEWEQRMMGEDDHGTVPLQTHQLALRSFWGGWQVPRFAIDQGLPAIEAHYAALGRRYGYEIPPPENLVNNLGYGALARGEIDQAIAIFQSNVRRYPQSANVYDSLGEGLEAAGRFEEAAGFYRQAVERGEAIEDPALRFYRQHLDGLAERRAAVESAATASAPGG